MPPDRRQGFTIIELLIAIAIIGVLSATGYTMLSDLIPRYRTYEAARELAANFQKIRALAAEDGREYRIALITPDADFLDETSSNEGLYYVQARYRAQGSPQWEWLPTDATVDLSDDEVGEGTVDLSTTLPGVSLVPWTALSGPSYDGDSNADCIVVSPRGWLVNPNGDFGTDGYVTVEFINKKALRRGVDERYQVHFSRAGMVRIDYNESLYGDVSDNGLGIDQRSSGSSSTSGGGGTPE